MENLAPAEPQARARLTDDQAQELVLRTVATHAESLLRVAYRHSLCADDAHDAYQRSMEILLRRAPTLDPRTIHRWLHVVVKHEAMEVREARAAVVATEDLDYDTHTSPHMSSPEEHALTEDRTTRAAEALRRLKPQELRTIWLKALGHSYSEISALTGFSPTKVNRCLTEGRKSFLERFDGIEAGTECERWQPVLSAMVDGEATAAQITEARPHLRNCPACRATLRGLDQANRPLAAVLPVGLVGAGAKLSGLLERLVPGGAGAAEAAGGAGVLGVGGAKVAALLAAGAVAVGGGTVAVESDADGRHGQPQKAASTISSKPVAAAPPTVVARVPRTSAVRSAPAKTAARARTAHRAAKAVTALRTGELKPLGHEVALSAGAPLPARTASAPTTTSSKRGPVAVPAGPNADSSAGEFAPQP
jgi:RNA polymerase sigma factor (sigma-70 family)